MNDYQRLLTVLEDDIRSLKDGYKRLRRCVNAKTSEGEFVQFSLHEEQEVDAHLGCVNVAACNLSDIIDRMEERVKRIKR